MKSVFFYYFILQNADKQGPLAVGSITSQRAGKFLIIWDLSLYLPSVVMAERIKKTCKKVGEDRVALSSTKFALESAR